MYRTWRVCLECAPTHGEARTDVECVPLPPQRGTVPSGHDEDVEAMSSYVAFQCLQLPTTTTLGYRPVTRFVPLKTAAFRINRTFHLYAAKKVLSFKVSDSFYTPFQFQTRPKHG
jgi:hypothetical protein